MDGVVWRPHRYARRCAEGPSKKLNKSCRKNSWGPNVWSSFLGKVLRKTYFCSRVRSTSSKKLRAFAWFFSIKCSEPLSKKNLQGFVPNVRKKLEYVLRTNSGRYSKRVPGRSEPKSCQNAKGIMKRNGSNKYRLKIQFTSNRRLIEFSLGRVFSINWFGGPSFFD